jgi:hypothetical protein
VYTFSHTTNVDLEKQKSVFSNELVLKTIENMESYHGFALKQTLQDKERLEVRVRTPFEFVEYELGHSS